MKRTTKGKSAFSAQVIEHANKLVEEEEELNKGNFKTIISTGSTLLNLSISGGRIRGGGLPGGILVEVFGPSQTGKTVLLSEIAGQVQRLNGDILFFDSEGRLDYEFSKLFGFHITKENYHMLDTVNNLFEKVQKWQPKRKGAVHGIFVDSLAALTTEIEMEDGDPYGSRRAKEFSMGFRKICRLLADKNYLMVCSNQVRDVIGATGGQAKTAPPGGQALKFYPSLRLEFYSSTKIEREEEIGGKTQSRVVGITSSIRVIKSSIWSPYRTAPISILYNYGLDDIRQNLQFIKVSTGKTVYSLEGMSLGNSMEKAIRIIEEDNLEPVLKEEVINLWEDIEKKFEVNRKPKNYEI